MRQLETKATGTHSFKMSAGIRVATEKEVTAGGEISATWLTGKRITFRAVTGALSQSHDICKHVKV